MEFLVLGPLEVRGSDGPLPLGGAKQRALVALLVLNVNRAVSRERLVDALWGDDPPETAVATLQVYVSRLRKLLPEASLLTRGSGYELAVEPEAIDLFRFERLVAEARRTEPEAASRLLREALALWRGPALAELAEPFARLEGNRLEDLRLTALEERLEADLELGRHADLIGELEVLIADHPHRERLRGQLMLALYRSGRQAESLAAYRAARETLDEIGIEPSERLRELHRRILAQDPTLLVTPPLLTHEIRLPAPLRVASPFPFVGRSRELATLRELLRRAEDGDGGQVALVGGEAGSGKSRLLRELAREAARGGALVLHGNSEAVVNSPYQPFVDALEFLVRETDPDALEACLGTRRTEIARLLPDLGSPVIPAADDPRTARHRLEGAVVELLTRVSRQHPLLVVLDDVHWADEPSLHLLRRLARAAPEGRLLLLAAYRDRTEDLRPEFLDALADLVRIDGVDRLTVEGLSDEEVGELIRQLTDARDDAAVAELATSVHELTDGSPFLLCELWRELVDSGAVDTSDGSPRLTRPLVELDSPEGVREVIQYRLTRLTPSAGEMLELASVAGARFELRVLEEAAESRLAAPLEEAVGSGMIEELPGPQISYRFSHELVRRALYDRLARVRCAELHRRFGDALERVHAGNTDRVASELAHHFAVAAPLGESERAVRYNLRAAELAMGAFGFEEAAARLSTALGLGMAGGSDRGRAELELSRALWITGKQERAVEVLEDARETARAVGDERLEWYVRLELAGIRPHRDADELETLGRSAAEVFERLGDDLGLARAHRRIALAASHRCAFGDAEHESEEALVHAIAAHDRQEETRIVDALCTALLYGPAPTPHAIARCRELLEPATRGSMREAVILSSLAGLEAMRGDITDARNDYQRAGTTFAELELPYFVGSLAVISGPIELAAGDAEGAERMLRLGIELLADRGTPDKIAIRSAFLALALLAQGRRDDAARALDSAVPEGRMPRIAHALAAGRVHDDVSAAREAVALAAETQALNLHADARASLADLLETAGGVEALEQRRLALELYERKGNELAARSLRLVVARV